MNNNEIREGIDTLLASDAEIITDVKILKLEVAPASDASNNVRVTYKDNWGNIHDKLYLAHPDSYITGVGLYITLLLALFGDSSVTFKTTGNISDNGYGYISGVIIQNKK
ncbi:hypothetical protein OO184_23000 [Photorhabdus sp. APURE]|uniref:hypothetical protein n=1 Tax=Photorhabdus aballayi TaxID=2991723 RepID=UPI00223CBDCC|nr:hypothetical protein [Photorhabdus aballayi]MCW7550720.1 hypothetical protein [Photorhabdus aballayi]